jgi:hypothetical protein
MMDEQPDRLRAACRPQLPHPYARYLISIPSIRNSGNLERPSSFPNGRFG